MSFQKALGLFGQAIDEIRKLPDMGISATRLTAVKPVKPAAEPARVKRPRMAAAPPPAAPARKGVKTVRTARTAAAEPAKAKRMGRPPKAKATDVASASVVRQSGEPRKLRMLDKVMMVVGKREFGIPDVIAGLKERGWLPATDKSTNYISLILGSNPEVFERVARGRYKVKPGVKLGKAERVASESDGGGEAEQAETEIQSLNSTSVSSDPVTTSMPGATSEVVRVAKPVMSAEPETSADITAELKQLGIGQNQAEANPFSG
jgi:hypothetical protein